MGLDARAEAAVTRVIGDLQGALGDQLIGAVLYGSATGDDWVRGRSDLNLAVLVGSAGPEALSAIVPAVRRWQGRGGALPLVIEPAFLARLAEVFPIEVTDIVHDHRLLCGRDLFADITVAPAALRRQLQQEARGKLLRLRAGYLDTAGSPSRIEHLLLGSLKTFVGILRHLGSLARGRMPRGLSEALRVGEEIVGPLPVMHRLLAHRSAGARAARRGLAAEVPAYLAEVERIVTHLDDHA